MKKKVLSILLAAALSAAALAGCGTAGKAQSAPGTAVTEEAAPAGEAENAAAASSGTPAAETKTPAEDPVDINVAALKGPTAMGMVSFMDAADQGSLTDNRYHFTISDAPDEIPPMIVQGKTDIAAVPVNLASVLYHKTEGGVTVLAINTLGVLYIADNGSPVSSVQEMKGRTIYASGKGSVPEYVLHYILERNGLDPAADVTIEWKSEHAEALASLLADPDALALLPQPFATVAQTKAESVQLDLDLTKEWDTLQNESEQPSALVMGVAIVRNEFLKEHPDAVMEFMEHYRESVEAVNSDTEAAAVLVGQYDIVPAPVAQKALPYCNITFISGNEMKEKLSGFLTVLHEQAPESVGGSLPGDDFYYGE
ncbi:ABC transporter substrate-binding protein [Lachnoclostridium sp. Marseille-P6806]|uniref:ABC transporter substrate-binding protein n=1 Tax=Lachnoclostridium sp. Marseille-P6806 TaxID=2364793 RepID=UPI001031F7D6|nr:ABC transporter substrate-binding protein [Lachnoclostridium sp. Marseille-P6806]